MRLGNVQHTGDLSHTHGIAGALKCEAKIGTSSAGSQKVEPSSGKRITTAPGCAGSLRFTTAR